MPALLAPLPDMSRLPALVMVAGATMLPPLVSIRMPIALSVSVLPIWPRLISELLELMVMAGVVDLMLMLPVEEMLILPAVLVARAVPVLLLMVVSARATTQGLASNAAAAAESIKRCFVKIQFSSMSADRARGCKTRLQP